MIETEILAQVKKEEAPQSPHALARRLGFWDAVAINVGIIIGVGIFRVPSEVAGYLSSAPVILLAWLLGSLMTLLGVLCYAELSSCVPETGGTYAFLRESYGRLAGFLFGWMEFLILRAGSLAAIGYIFAAYLSNFFPFGQGTEKGIAIAAILIFTGLNILGLHVGTRIQNFFSSLKVLSILAMSAAIYFFASVPAGSAAAAVPSRDFARLAPAMIPILFTYGGWHESSYMSGEFKDTRRSLPWAIILSALIVTFLYVLMNAAYLKAMRPQEMIENPAIASAVFQKFFGAPGKIMVTLVVLISASGALNSTVLTGARIPYALGRDHSKFSWLAQIHPRFGTPVRSFLLNGAWASALVLWGNFETLLFFCAFAKWLFFALAGTSVFVLRKKMRTPGAGPFRMIGYPAVPILFVASCLWICGTTIVHAPGAAGFGALLLAAGIPLYFLTRDATREKALK